MGQVLIAVVICFSGLAIKVGPLPFSTPASHLDFLGALLTIGWLVGLPNLINVIDGIDGLAGGVSLVLLLLVAAIAHQGGNFELLAGGTAGALLGFLCFNVPPARVYLGDSGAYFLGAQIGLYSLVNSRNGSNPIALAAPLFLLTLPALDAAVTLTRRALNGLPLFRADRKHLHHRLIAEGGTPREVLIWFYALNLIFFFMGLGALWSRGAWTPFLLGAAILVLLFCATLFSFSRRWFLVHRVVRNSFRVRNHVQHALSLTRWLNVQTRFCSGPDELWPRFVFVTEKLGFVDVLLLGRMKHRRWRRRGSVEPSVQCCYECSNDGYATLVFAAPACPLHGAQAAPPCERSGSCGLQRPRCLSNPQVFHTVSELLAEAWNASAAHWNKSWKNKPRALKAAMQPAYPKPNVDGQNGALADRDNE
jgi:UDP-GlcNAc:undecaprenyl-phosphate GlcNAc-1-phosphate transferase